MRKPFSKSLHDKNDKIAKSLAIEFINSFYEDLLAVENPDKYGIDIIIYEGDSVYGYAEAEVKHSWKGKKFPFNTIQFPERKRKLVEKSEGLPVLHFMTNTNQTMALIVDAFYVINSPLKEVPNKYVDRGEMFFQVPRIKAQFVDLETGDLL